MSKQLNIPFEIMLCRGCRNHRGKIALQLHIFGRSHRCAAYKCFQVFNLCLINRLGLEEWAKFKAAKVRKDYFSKPWSLAE